MTTSAWLLFITISLVTAFTPGPAVLLAMSNTMAWGLRKTLLGSSVGSAVGVFVVSGIAMAGLGTLLHTSAWLFAGLKTAGALYLMYLGYRQWTNPGSVFRKTAQVVEQADKSRLSLARQGLLVSLTNPKSILFFTALFPQFLHLDAPMLPQFLALTSTFTACALTSHVVYSLLATRLQGWFSTPRRAQAFNRVTGGAFGLLGLGLLRLKNPN
ncbi:LysE family translocator [Rhodoferax sp. WC2427]|uniref:LysE family translocator n=1 Tax=Rhodoferax sp. WC2427 TaxID=3234144 RepID=UPI0034652B70